MALSKTPEAPVCELGDATHPVVDVRGLASSFGVHLLQPGHDPGDGADEVVTEVESVREHVAELARAREGRGLPPAQGPRVPVLHALRAKVEHSSHVAVVDQVLEVAHGGHEAVGERGHVPHPRGHGSRVHLASVGEGQRERLLAHHVLARAGRGGHELLVVDVRRGHHDRVHSGGGEGGGGIREAGGARSQGGAPGHRIGVGIGEGGDLDARAQEQAWDVVGEGDAPHAEEGHADSVCAQWDVSLVTRKGAVKRSARREEPPTRTS